MATGTAGDSGRQYVTHQLHYLRRYFTKADAGLTLSMGFLPPGACVVDCGVAVIEVFAAGTNNRADIGVAADPDGLATLLALGTVGIIKDADLATSNDFYSESAREVSVVVDVTGTASATGKAIAYVLYNVPEGLLGAS